MKTINKTHSIIAFIFVILLFYSCDKQRVYEKNEKIPDAIWHKDNPVLFHVNINDTITPSNIYINVRNTVKYEYSNLFLFVTVTAPTENSIRDTVELILADKTGKWLGNGVSNIKDLQQLYKKDVRFSVPGIYTFKFVQAMRTDSLHHILDVGLRVEKIK